ncbi:FecR domain-containing protein [Pelagicoccus mobilis]|uniref:FecR domain-containing protein n=1 Tax=Pelagicoccus mobilis TaxID=415221 RepID=A0A934VMI7_9BACT|nr:FecR domain-containing protein [Pelagicoccus mobilis]MBK1875227.1 FecR domain-containing protein [Pelagicoccus mobilis]
MSTENASIKEVERLVSQMLDRQLSEEQATRLNALLRDSEDARQCYLELLDNHEALCTIYPGEVFETGLDIDEPIDDSSNEVPAASKFPWLPWISAAAAILTLILVVSLNFTNNAEKSLANTGTLSADTVARLIAAVDADWKDANHEPGSSLSTGEYSLTQGTAELEFHDGARVSLRGPASFELRSEGHLHVYSGKLVARIPEDALGFAVTTPQSEVVDLGTEFGLDVVENGRTDVHVIDGLVEVYERVSSRSAAGSTDGVQIGEGEARRFESEGGFRWVDIPFFSRQQILEDRHYGELGLSLLRGNVRLNDHVGKRHLKTTTANQSYIEVIPEKAATELEADTDVTIAKPGFYKRFGPSGGTIPAGTKVDSFLLHFRSVDGEPVRGVIKFDRPILGLICEQNELMVTDGLTGLEDVVFPNQAGGFRGLEPHSRQQIGKGSNIKNAGMSPDEVTLSQDLTTIRMSVNVVPDQGVDQMRVLVQSKD